MSLFIGAEAPPVAAGRVSVRGVPRPAVHRVPQASRTRSLPSIPVGYETRVIPTTESKGFASTAKRFVESDVGYYVS